MLVTAVDALELPQVDIARLDRFVHGRLNGRVREFRLVLHADGFIRIGQASTYHANQLAQHALMSATPLPIVANQIKVCDTAEALVG